MYIPTIDAPFWVSVASLLIVGWVVPVVMAAQALASTLAAKGKAGRDSKVAKESYTQEANNNALTNSNVVYNTQQNRAQNQYNTLRDAPNYREQESRRTRQDALLQALIGKNPGLGNLRGIVASPQDRQGQYFEDRQKGAMMESTYLPEDLWKERWNGLTQDFGGDDEQSGAQRSSILNSGQANLNTQQSAYQNWLDTQNKYSTANQNSALNQAKAMDQTATEKFASLLGMVGGTMGAYKAGQTQENNDAAFEEYLRKLLGGK